MGELVTAVEKGAASVGRVMARIEQSNGAGENNMDIDEGSGSIHPSRSMDISILS